jgi:uncharacterized membrane protein YkvI
LILDRMHAPRPSWFQRYLMPGLIFESVVVGGGYATGRELVEFFLNHGPLAGLLGMIATLVVWGIVLAVTFEFARLTRSFDYRTFFEHLIGRGWVLYEVCYYATLILVLSVIGAACSSVFHQSFGLPAWLGAAVLMLFVAVLVYFGNTLVERVLSAWGIALYALYGGMVLWCLTHYSDAIRQNLEVAPQDASWIAGGVAYAGYNLAAAPAVLFSLRHASRRRDALISGMAGGALAVLPGILLYLSVLAFYPAIAREPVPALLIVSRIGSRAFSLLFQIALFITLVKTGVGLLHALNERIAAAYSARRSRMPAALRPVASLAILAFALFLADRFGIVALVARGYGTITYAFLVIYVLPVMTIGLWRVCRARAAGSARD